MKKALPFLVMLFCAFVIRAQNNTQQPPLISLFSYMNVDVAAVKKTAPHFPFDYDNLNHFQQKLNDWLEQYPKEWKALSTLPVFTKGGIGWATYGIPEKYVEQDKVVSSSWYQWYKASGVTEEKKSSCFRIFLIWIIRLKEILRALILKEGLVFGSACIPKNISLF